MKQKIFLLIITISALWFNNTLAQVQPFKLGNSGTFRMRGADVLIYNSWYSPYFGDSKMGGIEIIHHDERTVTNGDVRLSNTPEQWDPVPHFVDRTIDSTGNRVLAKLSYPEFNFKYTIETKPSGDGIVVSVELDQPLPKKLEGRAGFNLEFLPSAYFGKNYLMDDRPGLLPRHPFGPMHKAKTGAFEASPLDTGSVLVMSPEDYTTRITIESKSGSLALYDGRNKAQNGWYVVRTLIPSNQTGKVVRWEITPHTIRGWTRKPVIGHSQVGYHPDQPKIAVIETDTNETQTKTISLYKITDDGKLTEKLSSTPQNWGKYLRYQYSRFVFSSVTEPGLYVLKYGDVQTKPFRIADDVYQKNMWQSTLDTYLPVQMDHMFINDRYRVWHGKSHMDDARQAPVNHLHFDMYKQGSDTDSQYQPGEHIPGLNVGGWYDAGDFDIRTQSQYATILTLVEAQEAFDVDWDETTVEQQNHYVDLHHPDDVPDILQQIEHGTLQLVSQYQAVGHALNGIIAPSIDQYTHMGDGSTKTDNLIYDPNLDSLQAQGSHSGRPDDRWAFTSKSTPLDYGSAAALAAASRVLQDYNDTLATKSRQLAKHVWDEEHRHEPVIFESGNTTGGPLKAEKFKAAAELLITSGGDQKYAQKINELWPYVQENFYSLGGWAARVISFMDNAYKQKVRMAVQDFKENLEKMRQQNPYGVPITGGGWGGSGAVMNLAKLNYQLHQAFPDIISAKATFDAMNYILGTHPANDISMVSGIGAFSKTKAYGNNRADYTFIPGGIVPGVVIIKPDYPELKINWPFLWYENEYVIPEAALFIYDAHAADALLHEN